MERILHGELCYFKSASLPQQEILQCPRRAELYAGRTPTTQIAISGKAAFLVHEDTTQRATGAEPTAHAFCNIDTHQADFLVSGDGADGAKLNTDRFFAMVAEQKINVGKAP